MEYSKQKRTEGTAVFFGDSMTENFGKHMTASTSICNMGISGDFAEGLIKRIDNVINFQPSSVFIMIGINDIIEKVPLSEIEANYLKILELIETNCPETTIYLQSTLPTIGLKSTLSSSKGINKTVQKLNAFLQKIAEKRGVVFIDMYSAFTNDTNELRKDLTLDGVHLNSQGYDIWKSHLSAYVTIDSASNRP